MVCAQSNELTPPAILLSFGTRVCLLCVCLLWSEVCARASTEHFCTRNRFIQCAMRARHACDAARTRTQLLTIDQQTRRRAIARLRSLSTAAQSVRVVNRDHPTHAHTHNTQLIRAACVCCAAHSTQAFIIHVDGQFPSNYGAIMGASHRARQSNATNTSARPTRFEIGPIMGVCTTFAGFMFAQCKRARARL